MGGLNMALAFDMEAGAVARRRVLNLRSASRPQHPRRGAALGCFCGAAVRALLACWTWRRSRRLLRRLSFAEPAHDEPPQRARHEPLRARR